VKNYTAIYFKYFGYGIDDVIPCENCGARAQDIHHIHGRGKGKDVIENLMAVCRKCHTACHGDSKTYLHPDVMQAVHDNYLKQHER
jgi:hypothetical protein